MATYAVGSGKPYATIQSAINAMGAANDVDGLIPVDAGTYTESLDLKKHPSGWCMPVNIYAADPNNRPVITCAATTYGMLADVATHSGTAGTRLPTFTNLIWSGGSATTALVNSSGGAPLRFYGCDFLSVMYGKTLFYQPYGGTSVTYRWVIDRCWFYAGAQVILNAYGGHGIITNSRFRWYNGAQSMLQTSGANWYAYNNSIKSSANGGILVMVGTAKNNAVEVASGTAPTRVFDCTTTYDYNCTYGWAGTNTGTNGGHNIVGSNPGFTAADSGDFSITTASPCYNAGTTLSDVTVDYRSVARPQGAAYDIGAYEVIPTTTVSSITVLSTTSIRLNLASAMASDSTWANAANFTITSGSGAPVTVTAAAASGNPGSSITLTTSEHTNATTYNVAWAGVTNVTSGNSNYTGQGTAPTIQSAVMTSPIYIVVTFSEAMLDEAALTTTTNYTISGASPFNPTLVTRINPTQVALTLGQSLGAASRTLAVYRPRDIAYNECNDTRTVAIYQTTVSTAVASVGFTGYKLRLNLAEQTYKVSGWGAATVTISGPTVVSCAYSTAADFATYIEYTLSEQEAGATYTVTWSGILGVVDGSTYFTGVGVAPSLASVSAASVTSMVVVWNEAMLDEAALTNAANYVLTPAAGSDTIDVLSVTRDSATQVTLTTTQQTPGRLYSIAIDGPRDLAHNVAHVTGSDVVQGFVTTIAVAEAQDATTVRVSFALPVASSTSLLDPNNYVFERLAPLLPAAPELVCYSVVTDGNNPTEYVDLTVNPQGYTQNYRVSLSDIDGVTDGHADFEGLNLYNHLSITGSVPVGNWGGA